MARRNTFFIPKTIKVSQYPPAQSDTYVKATTKYSTNAWAYKATDPTKSLIGAAGIGNDWYSANVGQVGQRFHIDLGSAKTINQVYYENGHDGAVGTGEGIKDFTLWGSNTASDFADLVYANDGTWVQLTTDISQMVVHVDADTADPRYITVTNSTAYRYYAFKFATTHNGANYYNIRRIELQM